MKPWQLSRKVEGLSNMMADPAKTETKIDINSLSEPERILLDKVQEITDKYSPGIPPQDVLEKNADLWYKGLEIFGKRVNELFVDVMPASFCCDEFETWYFKLYFYNFVLDWLDHVKDLRKMPKEKYQELFVERKEMGLFDVVFRFPKIKPETEKEHQP